MTLSREDYIKEFRGRFLLFLTEAWACRNSPPTSLGKLVDEHNVALRKLLNETYDALCPPPKEVPKSIQDVNGKLPAQPRRPA